MAKALVVDDNPSDRKLAEVIVMSMGAEVEVCSSGEDALKVLQEKTFDLFLFDLTMPEMSGHELIEKVRMLKSHSGTPIVIMSGLNEEEDIRIGIKAGAKDYLTKPMDPDIAKKKLAGFLNASQEEWREMPISKDSYGAKAELILRGVCQVVSISELGGHIHSGVRLAVGYTLELELEILKNHELDPASIRIESVTEKENRFEFEFSFIGLTEEKRQAIRSFCKEHFRETRKKEGED